MIGAKRRPHGLNMLQFQVNSMFVFIPELYDSTISEHGETRGEKRERGKKKKEAVAVSTQCRDSLRHDWYIANSYCSVCLSAI